MKNHKLRFYSIAPIAIALVGVLTWHISYKGLSHNIAGLPHISTSCDTRSHPILVIGQSQASNTGPVRAISSINSYAFLAGSCYHLRDPMPGTGGRGGSIWPRFADALEQPVTITDLAISGSAIERWTTPEQMRTVSRALTDFKAHGFGEPTIIWMQGETNAARHNTSTYYESQLQKVMALAPNNKWIITRESICTDVTSPSKELNVARDNIARRFRNVTIGPNLDNIPLSQRQPDRCHMTKANQELIARALADAFKRMIPALPASPASKLAVIGL